MPHSHTRSLYPAFCISFIRSFFFAFLPERIRYVRLFARLCSCECFVVVVVVAFFHHRSYFDYNYNCAVCCSHIHKHIICSNNCTHGSATVALTHTHINLHPICRKTTALQLSKCTHTHTHTRTWSHTCTQRDVYERYVYYFP